MTRLLRRSWLRLCRFVLWPWRYMRSVTCRAAWTEADDLDVELECAEYRWGPM